MIEFEVPKPIAMTNNALETVAVNMMRPKSRYFDEHEHEIPWDYINFMHMAMRSTGAGSLAPEDKKKTDAEGKERPRIGYQSLASMLEMLSWGDTGMYLVTPGGGLGAAAVEAAGTPEQKAKFLARFRGDKPVFGAMAMTEAGAGSDTSAIRTNAVLDKETNEWILNGEKIFITAGHKSLVESNGFIVVWATIDPSAGRAGMRSFVVEAGTPGVQVTKLEHKMGIRASDTASVVMQDARVPFENMLGSVEIVREPTTAGFKGAMATFDATRPLVAAMAMGVARAALDFLKEKLAEDGVQIRYGLPRAKMTNLFTHQGNNTFVFDVFHDVTHHVGDFDHFRLFKAACCWCRSTDTNTAGNKRRLRVVRYGVFIDGDVGTAKRCISRFSGNAFGNQGNQHQVIVGTV